VTKATLTVFPCITDSAGLVRCLLMYCDITSMILVLLTLFISEVNSRSSNASAAEETNIDQNPEYETRIEALYLGVSDIAYSKLSDIYGEDSSTSKRCWQKNIGQLIDVGDEVFCKAPEEGCANNCPPGYSQLNNGCYMLERGLLLNQTSAEDLCRISGGYLPMPNADTDVVMLNAYISNHTIDYVWLGMNDQAVEGEVVYEGTSQPVSWLSEGSLDKQTQDNDCVILAAGSQTGIQGADCAGEQAVLCEAYIKTSCPDTNPAHNPSHSSQPPPCWVHERGTAAYKNLDGVSIEQCESARLHWHKSYDTDWPGYTHISNNFYMLVAEGGNASEVDELCASHGGYGVRITDQEEQDQLAAYLTNNNITEGVWLGVVRSGELWTYSRTNYEILYHNCLPENSTETGCSSDNGDCMFMEPSQVGYTWRSGPCSDIHFALCEAYKLTYTHSYTWHNIVLMVLAFIGIIICTVGISCFLRTSPKEEQLQLLPSRPNDSE